MANTQNLQSNKTHLYQFQAFIVDASIKLKFPCNFWISWTKDKQIVETKDRYPIYNNKINFNTSISIKAQLIYDEIQKKYRQKKSLICVNLNSMNRPNETKLAGLLTIDLSKCIDSKQMEIINIYKLQRCPDKDSYIKLSIKSQYIQENIKINSCSSLSSLKGLSIGSSIIGSQLSDKLSRNSLENQNKNSLMRSTSQKFHVHQNKIKKQQNHANIILNNMTKKRHIIDMKSLEITQSMKIYNEIIKSPNRNTSDENQQQRLNDVGNRIQKIDVKSTKQQIIECKQQLLREIERVKSQGDEKNENNLYVLGQNIYNLNGKIQSSLNFNGKSDNQGIQKKVKQYEIENLRLLKQLQFFKYKNTEQNIQLEQKKLAIKKLEFEIQKYIKKSNNQNMEQMLQIQKSEGYQNQQKLNRLKYIQTSNQQKITNFNLLKSQIQKKNEKLEDEINRLNEYVKTKDRKIKCLQKQKQLLKQQSKVYVIKINNIEKQGKDKNRLIGELKQKIESLNVEVVGLKHNEQIIIRLKQEIDKLNMKIQEYRISNNEQIELNIQLEEMIRFNDEKQQRLRNSLLFLQKQTIKLTKLLAQKQQNSSIHQKDQIIEDQVDQVQNQRPIYQISQKSQVQQQDNLEQFKSKKNIYLNIPTHLNQSKQSPLHTTKQNNHIQKYPIPSLQQIKTHIQQSSNLQIKSNVPNSLSMTQQTPYFSTIYHRNIQILQSIKKLITQLSLYIHKIKFKFITYFQNISHTKLIVTSLRNLQLKTQAISQLILY